MRENLPLRIAVVGLSGSGKSTGGSYIEEFARDHGLTHARVKLARPLYELQEHLYRLAGLSYRHGAQDQVLMEAIAGTLRREQPEYLARDFVERLSGVKADLLVNDDLRDPHVDAAVLRRNAFRILRVRCDEELRRKRLTARGDPALADRSTAQIDLIEPDHVIDNSAGPEEYRAAVRTMLRSWL